MPKHHRNLKGEPLRERASTVVLIPRGIVLLALALAVALGRARAQTVELPRAPLVAGSDVERWLIDRCARPLGTPMSLRPFSGALLDSIASRCDLVPRRDGRATHAWARVSANSARPGTPRGGPVWAGKGLTMAVSAGITGSWKWGSYSAQPVAFWSQNLSYVPSRSVAMAADDFSDPWYAAIDRPYRFGRTALRGLDAGESWVRADLRWVAAGVSTAAQQWGPSTAEPLVLGSAAGGFPHVFVESGLPTNVLVGRLAWRWMAGMLTHSDFMQSPSHQRRIGVGAIGSFTPRGFTGLELGAARFYHTYATPGAVSLSVLARPFSALLNSTGLGGLELGSRAFNQLASVFIRIAPPTAGFETYGEFFRDDNAADLRDLVVQLDHQTAYLVGVRAGWGAAADRQLLTIENINGRITHLARVRNEPALYTNRDIPEGHTHRGLPLGSPSLPGGGAFMVRWDRQGRSGAWGLFGEVRRLAQNAEGGRWNDAAAGHYTLGARRETRWRGSRLGIEGALEPGFGDIPGTNVSLSVRVAR